MAQNQLEAAVLQSLSRWESRSRRQLAAAVSARLGRKVESWDIGPALENLTALKKAIEIEQTLDFPPRWALV